MARQWWRRGLRGMVILCLLGLGTITLYGAVWYHQGGRVLSVQTNSMRPIFTAGDGVIVHPIRVADIRVGDIISYKNAQNPAVVVSHRVIHVDRTTQRLATQGDRLPYPDPAVQRWQLLGRVTGVAPHYGSAANQVRRPLGLVIVVYLPVLLLIGYELMLVSRARRQASVYRLHG